MSLQASLLLPVFGMVFLTVGIALWMLKLRYKAVIEDGVSAKYFKLNRGAKLPEYLVRVTQHYENLFETPVLFYVAIVLVLVLNINDSVYVVLSWGFFLSRLLHAYIHTISNRLKYRKYAFMLTSVFLVAFWVKLLVDVLSL
jgi:hypothetical protein